MRVPPAKECVVGDCDGLRVHRLFCYPCWQKSFVLRMMGLIRG